MMYALRPEVHDAVFKAIEGAIPLPKPHPLGCHRRRVANRIIFRGLLWRLITGASWETIEAILDYQVSDTRLRARRDEWIEAGVFSELLAQAIVAYDRMIGVNLLELMIDGSNQLAPCGGEGTGPDYKHPGKQGWKWCTVVDSNGAVVAFEIDAANRNDYPMMFPVLDQLVAKGLLDADVHLYADRGFNYASTPARLAETYGITNFIAPPRGSAGNRVKRCPSGRRWIIESSNSWLTAYGQLRRNTDRKTDCRAAALSLALVLWYTRRLTNPRTCNYRPIG